MRFFEIDTPKTQAIKCEMLNQAGINSIGITFVATDFEMEDWLTQLMEIGFDIHKPALFLWEGVIMYLDRASVNSLVRFDRPHFIPSSYIYLIFEVQITLFIKK